MMYLIKVSIVLAFFYLVHYFFLKRTNLPSYHRWFLLAGIVVAFSIPNINVVKTEYREIPQYSTETIANFTANVSSETNETLEAWQWEGTIPYLYWLIVALLLTRLIINLISVYRRLRKSFPDSFKGINYRRSDEKLMPFSFFTFIVCNPKLFTKAELQLILTHEKVHVDEQHTIDLLLAEFLTTFLWFNPFAWFYKRSVNENLEFIADSKALESFDSPKEYQRLLLQTTLGEPAPVLSSTFFNSIIKKRIIMLQTPNSSKSHLLKYGILVPLLAIFILTFNASTVYIDKPAVPLENNLGLDQDQNVLRFTISKTTSDNRLSTLTELLKKEDVTVTFDKIKRDKNGYLTSIEMNFKSKTSSGNFVQNCDEPIKDIILEVDRSTKKVSYKSTNSNMSQKYKVEKDKPLNKVEADTLVFVSGDSSDVKVIRTKNGGNVYVWNSQGDNTYQFVQEDSTDNVVVWNSDAKTIKGNGQKIHVTASGNSNFVWNTADSTHTIKGNKVMFYSSDPQKARGLTTAKKSNSQVYILNRDAQDMQGRAYAIGSDQPNGTEQVFYLRNDSAENSVMLNRNSNASDLDRIISDMEDKGIKVKFSKLRRNRDGEITQIKISLENEKGNTASSVNKGDDGIANIYFGQNGNGLYIKSNK